MNCSLCSEAPASVFRPAYAVCKPCWRELRRREMEDAPVDNAPTCAIDGSVLNASGTCADCVTRALVDGHRKMRVAS